MDNTTINIEEIKERLCYYDERHPDNQLEFKEVNPDFDKSDSGDCFCDNCFYRRTELANIILKLIDKLDNG